MQRRINLRFYQLKPVRGNDEERRSAFQILSQCIATLPNPCYGIDRMNGKVVQSGQPELQQGLHVGFLTNVQTHEIPAHYNAQTHALSALQIEDGDGLGAPTGYVFDPATCIVMIEAARGCATIQMLCGFLRKNQPNLPEFEEALVLNPQEIERLRRFNGVAKLEVKIARVEGGTIFDSQDRSVNDMVRAANDIDTDRLELSFSSRVNRSNTGLTRSSVLSRVISLLPFIQTNEVTELRVTGYEEEGVSGGKTIIDFVQHKVEAFIEVGTQRIHGDFARQVRQERLINAYMEMRPSLMASYAWNGQN